MGTRRQGRLPSSTVLACQAWNDKSPVIPNLTPCQQPKPRMSSIPGNQCLTAVPTSEQLTGDSSGQPVGSGNLRGLSQSTGLERAALESGRRPSGTVRAEEPSPGAPTSLGRTKPLQSLPAPVWVRQGLPGLGLLASRVLKGHLRASARCQLRPLSGSTASSRAVLPIPISSALGASARTSKATRLYRDSPLGLHTAAFPDTPCTLRSL